MLRVKACECVRECMRAEHSVRACLYVRLNAPRRVRLFEMIVCEANPTHARVCLLVCMHVIIYMYDYTHREVSGRPRARAPFLNNLIRRSQRYNLMHSQAEKHTECDICRDGERTFRIEYKLHLSHHKKQNNKNQGINN